MWSTGIANLYKLRGFTNFLVFPIIFLFLLAFAGWRTPEAETSVEFLSESVDGVLLLGKDGGYQTEEPIRVVIHNKGDSMVDISFQTLPDNQVESEENSAAIYVQTELAGGSFTLKSGKIQSVELNFSMPNNQDNNAHSRSVSADEASTASNGGGSERSGVFQNIWTKTRHFLENKQPEKQTGLLIVLTDGVDSDAIPYAFTLQSAFDKNILPMSILIVVVGGLILAVAAVLGAIIPILRKKEQFDGKVRALAMLPMGVAEWKLDDSWVVNLSLAITILAGAAAILPETVKAFKTSYDSLIFVFGALTILGAFAYNASTRPDPEKEEDKETYKKQGRTWVFLLTSFLVVWALLGQIGMQLMAVQQLRNIDSGIPDFFLIFFLVILTFLIIVIPITTSKSLKQTILDQKIDEHKDAYLQSKIYLHKAKEVRRTSLKWQEEMEGKSDLTDVIKSIQGEFTKIVPYEVPAELAGEDEFRKLYEHFRELFHNNLLHLLKNVANTPKVAKGLFEEMAKDAEEAIKLLDQTLPVEDVIAAFYSSLWAPRKVRKQNYKETLKSISRHLKVACAQASSSMEPDRVIGPNEELYTNILTALAELDKALGLAGSKDPIHANLKKLFEIAKAKWEVMTIDELRAALCQLHERVEACNSRLIKYFNENGEAADFALNGRLAKTLRPLATALGKNQVPYPKPFPIDSAVLDAAKDLKAAITRLRSRQASSDDHSWVEDLQYLNDQIDELNDLNRVGVAKLPSINLPRRPVVRNIMSDTVSLETELGHLEKSLDSIETNPYFTSGVDFQKRRMNAIQQHSQKKVSGTKVTLL